MTDLSSAAGRRLTMLEVKEAARAALSVLTTSEDPL
jgi:hypothetical protein